VRVDLADAEERGDLPGSGPARQVLRDMIAGGTRAEADS